MNRLTALLVLSTVALAGCASQGGYQGMNADQISALAKMKDANVNCTKGETSLLGRFFSVFVNLDKGVIPDGGITVTPDCGVSITNTRVVTTTTTTVTPISKPAQ